MAARQKSVKKVGAAVAADETNLYFNQVMEYAPDDEIPLALSNEIIQNKTHNILSIILQLDKSSNFTTS